LLRQSRYVRDTFRRCSRSREGIRGVLTLFEGVATGAADGYYRMSEVPAATLLHLGPGLANGLANLHNANKARSGIINIVGQHATYHVALDTPLSSDVEAIARPYSSWIRTSQSSIECRPGQCSRHYHSGTSAARPNRNLDPTCRRCLGKRVRSRDPTSAFRAFHR